MSRVVYSPGYNIAFYGLERLHPFDSLSWSDKGNLKAGDLVQVEFVAANPNIARIVDCRSAPLPWWNGSVLLFPIVGSGCILHVFVSSPHDR